MSQEIPSTRVLGIRVDLLDMERTLDLVDRFIETRGTHQIVVVNVAKIVKALRDDYLRGVIESADLCGADGVPVVWVSRFMGTAPIPGRVSGLDLMESIVERAAAKGYRLYFFGAEQDVVEDVVRRYRRRFPSLQVAGFRNGYFRPEEEEDIARQIGGSGADVLFVAFGTPKKERFISQYKHLMNVPVIHGVGGSFDVVAGKVSRAPLWMQRSGLEWLYRTLQEPRRMWRRYLVTNSLFVYYLVLAALRLRKFD